MKSFVKFAALLVATPLAAVACAKGSTAEGFTNVTDMTSATEPTEPAAPEPEKPLPPPSADDSSTAGNENEKSPDAGKAAEPTAPAPDAGSATAGGACTTAPPSNKCGLTPQCGCKTSETCDVTTKTDGSVSCVKAGSKPQGKPCSATTECATGLTCAYGACRPYCASQGAACTGTGLGQCEGFYDKGVAVPNAQVCALTCDLRSPSAACGSNTCVWDSAANVTDCDQAGSLEAFAPCSTYNACKPGLACVNNPLYGTECEPWCRVGLNDCPLMSFCKDVYGDKAPMVGSTKLGLCQ